MSSGLLGSSWDLLVGWTLGQRIGDPAIAMSTLLFEEADNGTGHSRTSRTNPKTTTSWGTPEPNPVGNRCNGSYRQTYPAKRVSNHHVLAGGQWGAGEDTGDCGHCALQWVNPLFSAMSKDVLAVPCTASHICIIFSILRETCIELNTSQHDER